MNELCSHTCHVKLQVGLQDTETESSQLCEAMELVNARRVKEYMITMSTMTSVIPITIPKRHARFLAAQSTPILAGAELVDREQRQVTILSIFIAVHLFVKMPSWDFFFFHYLVFAMCRKLIL